MKLLFLKRSFDFTLSLIGIVISLPLWGLFAFLVWLESEGPVFYRQRRAGKGGREFTVLKFRTMVRDADKMGVWTEENDPRVTRVGKFLRRTAMDELPSLLSILKGDMSFVGPRALAVEEQRLLEKQIPGFENRLAVRPGLTGLAQVYNPEDDPRRKLELDLEYINKMSFYFDIKLIILSFYNTFTARWDRRSGKQVQRKD